MPNSITHSFFPYRAITECGGVEWPRGARVAVWIIPNIEHFHLDVGNPAPDVRNYSRRDYGNRVGVWRLMEVLERHGVRATVALNGEVVDCYPQIIEAANGLGWEFMGHGLTNSIVSAGMEYEHERRMIAETRDKIRQTGQKMRGWLGPGLTETWNTLGLLEEAGVEYVADWVNDDLPYKMNGGLWSIPYTLELNDMPLFNNPSISIVDFERRIRDSFDVLYQEGGQIPRVMAIALHPFLIGVPHRIKYLDAALSYMVGHSGVWFATGSEIIEACRSQSL